MNLPEVPLADLFQAHRQGLWGAVRGVLGSGADIAEVLQDAFLKGWRALQQGERPRDPVAWLYVVTWHAAIDARRRGRRRPVHHSLDPCDEENAVPAIRQPSPDHALEQRDEVAMAQRAIERLADPEKQVFLLRVSGGLTFEAVADALQIPVGTAKTRMRAALQKVRQRLGVAVAPPEDPQDQGSGPQARNTGGRS